MGGWGLMSKFCSSQFLLLKSSRTFPLVHPVILLVFIISRLFSLFRFPVLYLTFLFYFFFGLP